MPTSLDYRKLADAALADADAATLDNVRDRCLRSEKAWRALATRSEKSERGRTAAVPAPEAAEQPVITIPA